MSQFGEDLLLLPLLLNVTLGRVGTFVELGAWDGIRLSNTYMLERCFNWTGALIEANPSNYAQLVRSERRAIKINYAICNKDRGFVPITREGMAVAGQVGMMSESYLATHRIGDNINDTVPVPCTRFDRLLTSFNMGHVNYLSLDVEGAEWEVLSTVNPARFDVILVEMDGFNAHKDRRIHRYLLESGLCKCIKYRPYLSSVYSTYCCNN